MAKKAQKPKTAKRARDQRANATSCVGQRRARTPSAPREDASKRWTMSAARRKPTNLARQEKGSEAATVIKGTHAPEASANPAVRRWPARPRPVEHDREHSTDCLPSRTTV